MDSAPRTAHTLGVPPASSSHADLDLVRAALANQAAAADALLARLRCVPRILAAHNHRRGSPLTQQELMDVAQDTLMAVWRKLDAFAGRAALETWVFRFCVQEFMNAVRRKQRDQLRMVELPDADSEPAAVAKDVSWETALLVHDALATLAPMEAEVLRLKHIDGLTFDEMAVQLGRSANTLKAVYYRGARRLRTRIAEKEGR